MIVYRATKNGFIDDVDSNQIGEIIHSAYRKAHNREVSRSEITAWQNSLGCMQRILSDTTIPNDVGVAVEFGIPGSTKRVDFILTGRNDAGRSAVIIVELKQWSQVQETRKDGVVRTFINGAEREMNHPSYQAWSYATLLEDYNQDVRDRQMALRPCAYLHNCSSGSAIHSDFYRPYTDRAPAFLQSEADKLRAFIKSYVRHGDGGEAIYEIENGRIRPSKNLADHLASLLQGNRDFTLIDDQKLVYETALELATGPAAQRKAVLVVSGGPGTGKSVVAINLLVELIQKGKNVHYVTKNAAPRAVYEQMLAGTLAKSRISNLFKGSGTYFEAQPNTFDVLVVDEAHRLTEKSGFYQNEGENQIKEIIRAAKLSIFFVDDCQRVTFSDIGGKDAIKQWARTLGAHVVEMALQSQFRCNGSDGYLAWVDHSLQIRETANPAGAGLGYEFVVCDDPNELRRLVVERNGVRNKARMVAGYCWDWASKKKPGAFDIVVPEHNFKARWNLADDGSLWLIKPESVNEVGCIHTCQGLELDYVGVILGPDLVVRNGKIVTDAGERSRHDKSIKGYKKLLKGEPAAARALADEIIKNTYRTLMTRAQKGCFVFSVDPETNAYLKAAASGALPAAPAEPAAPYEGLPLRLLEPEHVKPFENAVPVYDLQVAAGSFSSEQAIDPNGCDWVELPEPFVPKIGYFVTRVVGESMNRRIPNGSWCLFRAAPAGSREGKVVLVQHRDIQGPENVGQYTVKIYHSEKRMLDDAWVHARIVLKPDSNQSGFSPIVLDGDAATELSVRGELVAVLGQL